MVMMLTLYLLNLYIWLHIMPGYSYILLICDDLWTWLMEMAYYCTLFIPCSTKKYYSQSASFKALESCIVLQSSKTYLCFNKWEFKDSSCSDKGYVAFRRYIHIKDVKQVPLRSRTQRGAGVCSKHNLTMYCQIVPLLCAY